MDAAYKMWIEDLPLDAIVQRIGELSADSDVPEAVEMFELVKGMATRAFSKIYEEDSAAGLIPIATEVPFEAPIYDNAGKRVNGVKIRGIIDALMYSRTSNLLITHEHKQAKLHVETIEKRIPFDPQISTYVDAARYLLDSGALDAVLWAHGVEDAKGVRVGPVVYNVARAAMPKTPKTNKDGTISVAQIDTLPEIYQEALQTQKNPTWYDKALATGSPEKIEAAEQRYLELRRKQSALLEDLYSNVGSYFGRFDHFRSEREMNDWRRDLVKDVKRVRLAWLRDDEITRNPGNCSMPWSMSCEYSSICLDRQDESIRAALFTTPEERNKVVETEEADPIGF